MSIRNAAVPVPRAPSLMRDGKDLDPIGQLDVDDVKRKAPNQHALDVVVRDSRDRRSRSGGRARCAGARDRPCSGSRARVRSAAHRTTQLRSSFRPGHRGRSVADASTAAEIALDASSNLGPGLPGILSGASTGRALRDLGSPCGLHAVVGAGVQACDQLGGQLGPARGIELQRLLEEPGSSLGHVGKVPRAFWPNKPGDTSCRREMCVLHFAQPWRVRGALGSSVDVRCDIGDDDACSCTPLWAAPGKDVVGARTS